MTDECWSTKKGEKFDQGECLYLCRKSGRWESSSLCVKTNLLKSFSAISKGRLSLSSPSLSSFVSCFCGEREYRFFVMERARTRRQSSTRERGLSADSVGFHDIALNAVGSSVHCCPNTNCCSSTLPCILHANFLVPSLRWEKKSWRKDQTLPCSKSVQIHLDSCCNRFPTISLPIPPPSLCYNQPGQCIAFICSPSLLWVSVFSSICSIFGLHQLWRNHLQNRYPRCLWKICNRN